MCPTPRPPSFISKDNNILQKLISIDLIKIKRFQQKNLCVMFYAQRRRDYMLDSKKKKKKKKKDSSLSKLLASFIPKNTYSQNISNKIFQQSCGEYYAQRETLHTSMRIVNSL